LFLFELLEEKKISKTFKNMNETVNDFEFFIKNLSDYLPYLLLHSFGSFLGVIGNIAIIGALIVTKELHNATNIIIANIALADFILSSIVDTLTIAGIYNSN
jgi:hypothetical protein